MRRKPRPPAPTGLTTTEFTAKTGITRPQLHRWARAGVLPGHPSRGRGVRYDDAYVERVRTVARLLDEGLTLDEVRERIEQAGAEPVVTTATAGEPTIPATASAPASASGPSAIAPSTTTTATVPTATAAELPAERWERIVLLPGLELLVRSDAGPVLRRIAGEIWTQFGSTAR